MTAPILVTLPQNETHLQTVAMLLPKLAAGGWRVIAVDMDQVYHQQLNFDGVDGLEVRSIESVCERPFYSLQFHRQLQALQSAAPRIRAASEDASVVLAFNDGAMQRVALGHARRRGRRTALLLDGMISRYEDAHGRVRRAARAVGREIATTRFGHWLPSEVGLFPVDLLFVIGEHSAQILRERGAKASRIIASGLPRFPTEELEDAAAQAPVILYLTGAFNWHGDHATQTAQVADVVAAADVARPLGCDFRVRVHPRDQLEPYVAQGVEARHAEGSMATDIRAAGIVLSLVSTGILEAIAMGRVSWSMCIHPAWRRFSRSFAADRRFGAIRSDAVLEAEIRRVSEAGEYIEELRQERAALKDYVAGAGVQATDRIVRELGSLRHHGAAPVRLPSSVGEERR